MRRREQRAEQQRAGDGARKRADAPMDVPERRARTEGAGE
jgi:hypothetical protein